MRNLRVTDVFHPFVATYHANRLSIFCSVVSPCEDYSHVAQFAVRSPTNIYQYHSPLRSVAVDCALLLIRVLNENYLTLYMFLI